MSDMSRGLAQKNMLHKTVHLRTMIFAVKVVNQELLLAAWIYIRVRCYLISNPKQSSCKKSVWPPRRL